MRRQDTFFTQDSCDRCGNPLHARILSWFNEDTICMDCSDKEKPIKAALREKGIDNAMEGCGYVPDPDKALGQMAEKLYDRFLETNEELMKGIDHDDCDMEADRLFDCFVEQFPDTPGEVNDLVYEHIYAGLT